MKSKKFSQLLINSLVVCVVLFSGMFQPGTVASTVSAQIGSATMPPPILTFPGMTRAQADPAFIAGSERPDISGAVGPALYIQAVNFSVAMYSKGGALLTPGIVSFGTFWTGASTTTLCDTAANHHGQATVIYDHMAQRWFIADLAYEYILSGPYYICMAVTNSTAGDTPTTFNSTSWNYFALKAQASWPYSMPGQVRIGLWSNGYYIAFDQFDVYNNGQNLTPNGSRVWAVNRDDLNNNIDPFRAVGYYLPEERNYHGLVPATLQGDPSGNIPEFFGAIAPPKTIYLFKWTVDWLSPGTSDFSLPPTILTATNAFNTLKGFMVPQLSTTEKLDLVGDRLTSLKYRQTNEGSTMVQSLWASHTSWNGNAGALRWYEIRIPNTGPSIYQEGIYSSGEQTRWVSDLAVDQAGNMAIGYSVSSSAMYPSIRYTGHLASDPLNTLMTEALFIDEVQAGDPVVSSLTFQDDLNGWPAGAWGLKTSLSVDPTNQCVFWYTNEYYPWYTAHNNWFTRIGFFRLPGCASGMTTRVSLDKDNNQGLGSSGIDDNAYSTAVSADGRYVAFSSDADNFDAVLKDSNQMRDVFLRDRDSDNDGIFDETGGVNTIRISKPSKYVEADGNSWQVSISANGRYIGYSSEASNLVPGDSNGTMDVFLYDAINTTTTRVSVSSSGLQGNSRSDQPSISADGYYIAFRSFADNLITTDTNLFSDIFVRDLRAGKTIRVSEGTFGAQAAGDSYSPAISSSGRFVAFGSLANNLDGNDANGVGDIYLRDRDTNTNNLFDEPGAVRTVLISAVPGDASFTAGNLKSSDPTITSNQWNVFVGFTSTATNLVTTPVIPANTPQQVYLRTMPFDMLTGTTQLVSTAYTGEPANGSCYSPAISANTRFIAYASAASNIDVQPIINGFTNIYLYDVELQGMQRNSVGYDGDEPNGNSRDPSISADGGHVIFYSNASNLVPNDTNAMWDVFACDKCRANLNVGNTYWNYLPAIHR